MSISLVKGQKIDLTKGNAGLNKVVFGLGWDTNRYDGNADFDLDVSAFFTDDSGKVTGEQDFVFYGQPQHPSGALIYSGDNRTGEGGGDDETMVVELNKIPSNITKISFSATIYDAENRLQNFGMVDNSYIRAYNADTNALSVVVRQKLLKKMILKFSFVQIQHVLGNSLVDSIMRSPETR